MLRASLLLAGGLWLFACGGTPEVSVTIADDPAIQAFSQLKNNGGDLYFYIQYNDLHDQPQTPIAFPTTCNADPAPPACGFSYGNPDPARNLLLLQKFNIATASSAYTIPEKRPMTVQAYLRKADNAFLACGAATVLNQDGAAATIQLRGTCPP